MIWFLGKYCDDRSIPKKQKTLGISGQERIAGKTAKEKSIVYGGYRVNVSLEEKQILYIFGCESYENTIYRLKWIATLTVDERIQGKILYLIKKLENEKIKEVYVYFYRELRLEMERYFEAKHYIYKVENCTN